MRLDTIHALKYLQDVGITISRATYFRQKKKVEELKLRRLYHIAKIGFQDQHLERIDNCELIEKLMWENYNECKEPFKRVLILEKILGIQPYLSSYYEATTDVIKESDLMKNYCIPPLETSDDLDSVYDKKNG